MIKILLLTALFGACGYLGFETSKVFERNQNLYFDLLSFTKSIKNEISFLKTDILTMLKKYEYNSKFQEILMVYINLLENKNEFSQNDIILLLEKNGIVTQVEKNTISQMFFALGNIGYVEQLERLDFYIEQYTSFFEKSREKSSKMMPLCKKMGVLVGLLICIVLI